MLVGRIVRDHSMKAVEQYFHVAQFVLYNFVLTNTHLHVWIDKCATI